MNDVIDCHLLYARYKKINTPPIGAKINGKTLDVFFSRYPQ